MAARVAAEPRVLGPGGRIKHVVVFYQENHSFDETLGYFCKQNHHRCDGYVGPVTLSNGLVVNMMVSSDGVPNAGHDVASQAAAINGGKMDGWEWVPGCARKKPYHYFCLSYYKPKQIPNLTSLAKAFVVSDRTFSMYNSPSWGGHIYAAAATQDNFTGDNPGPIPPIKGWEARHGWGCDSKLVGQWQDPVSGAFSNQPSCIPARPGTLDPKKYPYNGPFRASPVKWVPTIFDRLDAKHLSWKLYSGTRVWAICPSFAECQYGPQHKKVVPTHQILADARDNKLPAYSVLLPEGVTSQHNGASMRQGDNWIGQALSALEHSPAWSSTAVFITYDDCGCFYDHVPPGVNPDGTKQGIRMPMVVVSPYAKRGYTDHHPATFASILRFTEKTFGLKALSVNDKNAYDYMSSFDFAAPPTGPRVVMRSHPVSAATKRYLAMHPVDVDDPT